MDSCPNCKSKRINEVPGFANTGNRNSYYCMNCGKEYNYKGLELQPIFEVRKVV